MFIFVDYFKVKLKVEIKKHENIFMWLNVFEENTIIYFVFNNFKKFFLNLLI